MSAWMLIIDIMVYFGDKFVGTNLFSHNYCFYTGIVQNPICRSIFQDGRKVRSALYFFVSSPEYLCLNGTLSWLPRVIWTKKGKAQPWLAPAQFTPCWVFGWNKNSTPEPQQPNCCFGCGKDCLRLDQLVNTALPDGEGGRHCPVE